MVDALGQRVVRAVFFCKRFFHVPSVASEVFQGGESMVHVVRFIKRFEVIGVIFAESLHCGAQSYLALNVSLHIIVLADRRLSGHWHAGNLPIKFVEPQAVIFYAVRHTVATWRASR